MQRNVCIALDVDDVVSAQRLVTKLASTRPIFKVGSHLFTGGEGKKIIDHIHAAGGKVFLDLKFHDIPNTVANAARTATRMGIHLFNVHALGGFDMMRAAAEAAAEETERINCEKPIVLAVTVLTSMSEEDLKQNLHVDDPLDAYIGHLAGLAKKAGLEGVVCSPREIALVKQACGPDFLVVTPGIRPTWSLDMHDQKRVSSPKQAFNAGADYIVVGRPVIDAPDPALALERLLDEIDE